MEWIQDESRLASTVEEKQRIMDLHSRAVKDYLCKYISVPTCYHGVQSMIL